MAIEQHPAQIAAKLKAADWSDLSRLYGTKDTEFWFYSVCAVSGPRFMFNLTSPLLHDIRSGSGKIAEVGLLTSPLDLYTSAIADYDCTSDLAHKMRLGEPMALAMTAYVVNQPSWNTLAGDTSPDEKHVLVLDWKTKAGPRSAQACFMTPPGQMADRSMLLEVSMAIYNKHYGAKPKTIFEA
jgi:hypothetical protein